MSVSFVFVPPTSFAVNTISIREQKKGRKTAGDMISPIPALEEKRSLKFLAILLLCGN